MDYYFYCPKCKSRLYPDDRDCMDKVGVCGYCVSYDTTPDKRFKKAYEEKRKEKNGRVQLGR